MAQISNLAASQLVLVCVVGNTVAERISDAERSALTSQVEAGLSTSPLVQPMSVSNSTGAGRRA